jgi:hypothetical protein
MGRIDPRALRAARLAGVALVALGAVDVVLRGHSLSRHEEGAILLAAGAALLVLHVGFVRVGGGTRASDAQLAAALSVPFIPLGIGLLAFSRSSASLGGDGFDPVRDAASDALIGAGLLYAVAYLLTRHPRWVLVVALALGFGADLRSSAPVPIIGIGSESWTPTLILCVAAAVAVGAGLAWRTAAAEQQNLFVAAAIMLAAASETRTFASSPDAGRDLFYAAVLAAEVAIAWWRTTPAVAFSIVVTGGFLASSLSQRSGLLGVALALAGAALAGGATLWISRSPDGLSGAGDGTPPPAAT